MGKCQQVPQERGRDARNPVERGVEVFLLLLHNLLGEAVPSLRRSSKIEDEGNAFRELCHSGPEN